ncbi:MAG: SDR family oxidoreductase [Balneolaceae bacterium]|nr:MAG: SDR family oxidoreductase [Balneolaceae bacterium]
MNTGQLHNKEIYKEKTVIVTGASNGIGRAVAKAFASEHARVILADVDEPTGRKLEQSLVAAGDTAFFIRTDVSDPESIHQMITKSVTKTGGIDILINNAGIAGSTSFDELTVDEWDKVLNTNLRGAFLCSQEASRHMTNGGAIINMASTRASMSEPDWEAYAASKGGLVSLTHAMALSLAPKRITVNAISPGWIHTRDPKNLRDIDHSQHPAGRVGKPRDIARACLFLCHPENRFITGEQLVIDGGMTRKMIYEH